MPAVYRSWLLTVWLVAMVAFFGAGPAQSTADKLHTVVVPIENWQGDGFCQRDTVAGDSFGSLRELPIIGEVLSKPLMAHCHCSGAETIDLNPLTAEEPRLTIEMDEARPASDGSWGGYELINLRISADGTIPEGKSERLKQRLKLAILFSLKNIFALNKCASVSVELAPDLFGVRTGRLSSPVSARSGVYDSLVRELSASDRCEAGVPLTYEWKRVDYDRDTHCR